MSKVHERVKFRLFVMPCCGQQLCWVNPRLPNHCPECGEAVFIRIKRQPEHTLLNDEDAWLHYDSAKEIKHG